MYVHRYTEIIVSQIDQINTEYTYTYALHEYYVVLYLHYTNLLA